MTGAINHPDHFGEMLGSFMLDANALEIVARAYDREDSAQRGEPDPWGDELGGDDQQWRDERLACALTALEALGEYWRTINGVDAAP